MFLSINLKTRGLGISYMFNKFLRKYNNIMYSLSTGHFLRTYNYIIIVFLMFTSLSSSSVIALYTV